MNILFDLGALLTEKGGHSTPSGAQQCAATGENGQCQADGNTSTGSSPSGWARGLAFLEAAAESGDIRALEKLARLYETGEHSVAMNRSKQLYRALISQHRLQDSNSLESLATQSMLHAKLAAMTLKEKVVGAIWPKAQSGTRDVLALETDETMAFSSNLFLFMDDSDGLCITSAGSLGACDETALWTTVGTQFVNFMNPRPKPMCLSQLTTVPASKALVVESCGSPGSRDWMLEGRKLSHRNGEECVIRDLPGHSLSLQPCFRGHTAFATIEVGLPDREGFILKARDGLCFDGEKFGSCDSYEAGWGVVMNDLTEGGQYSFYRTHGGFFGGRKQCLQKQGVKDGVQMVGLGVCTTRAASRWNLKGGYLIEDQGKRCLGRVGGKPALVPMTSQVPCENLTLLFMEQQGMYD